MTRPARSGGTPPRSAKPARHTDSAHGRVQRTVADLVEAMDVIAPVAAAQAWDNVGLLAGDMSAALHKILLCIDLTDEVAQEAIAGRVDAVLAYHPPIFRPIKRLVVPAGGTEAAVFRCIRAGVAIYATHTALDAAEGGTNDVLARLCGLHETRALEYVDEPSASVSSGTSRFKLVVFVPSSDVEKVAEALFEAGAGHIGDYRECSFRSPGHGTFFGTESTQPAVGRQGRRETVEETRIETVVPSESLPAVVAGLRAAHPYEEPAFDIYPLRPEPVAGCGRVGEFARPTTLRRLAQRLQRVTHAKLVQLVGSPAAVIRRAVIVAGAAGSLPFRHPLAAGDVVITGEIRHHDALTMRRLGCCAIALGHWASERPVLVHLANRLTECLPGLKTALSVADHDPFAALSARASAPPNRTRTEA